MNRQITLKDIGMNMPKQIDRSIYVTPCGGCICHHCANNVDCCEYAGPEQEFACFNCDECINYSEGTKRDSWKASCSKYKIANACAIKMRKRFKVVKGDYERYIIFEKLS